MSQGTQSVDMRHLEAELVKVCVRGRERQEVNERHAELNAARVKVNQKLETLKVKSLTLKKMQKDLDERAQEAEVWE
jgi:hypothetical protein